MGLKNVFNNTLEKLGYISQKSNSTATIVNQNLMDLFRLGTHSHVTPQEAYNIYEFNSSVSDAVDSIASKVADMTPIIKKSDGEVVKDHEVLKFLKRPNKTQYYRDFMEATASNFLLNKNSYIQIIGNIKSRPLELWNLKNTWVSITEQPNAASYIVTVSDFFGFLTGSFIMTSDTGRILDTTNLRELSHIKGFALTRNSLEAVSILGSIERDVSMIDQSNNHNLTLLDKGFNGSGLVSVDTDDTESFEQFTKDFRNKYQGSGNAGSPVVAKGKDIKFESFGQTNRDMEYSKTKKMSQDTVYQRFEIPKALVDGSSQTYDNYQTARGALYDDAVFPLGNKIFEGLTKIFFDRNLMGEDEFLTYDISSIPALQIRVNQELKSRRESHSLSLNELRTVAGYESVSGGDVILVPGSMVPVATDEFTEDNLDDPSKEFVATMIKNGADSSEIKGLWFEYKAAFRPNKKSAS